MPSPLPRIRALLKSPTGGPQAIELLHAIGDEALYEKLLDGVRIAGRGVEFGATFSRGSLPIVLRLLGMARGPRAEALRRALTRLSLGGAHRDLRFLRHLTGLRTLWIFGLPEVEGYEGCPPLERLFLHATPIDLARWAHPIRRLELQGPGVLHLERAHIERLRIEELDLGVVAPQPGALAGLTVRQLSLSLTHAPELLPALTAVDDLSLSGLQDWAQLGGLRPRRLTLHRGHLDSLAGVPDSVEELSLSRVEGAFDPSQLDHLPRLRRLSISPTPDDPGPLLARRPRFDDLFLGGLMGNDLGLAPLAEPRSSYRKQAPRSTDDLALLEALARDPVVEVARAAATRLVELGHPERLAQVMGPAAWESLARHPIARSEEQLGSALGDPAQRAAALAWLALTPARPPQPPSDAAAERLPAISGSPGLETLRDLALAPPLAPEPLLPLPAQVEVSEAQHYRNFDLARRPVAPPDAATVRAVSLGGPWSDRDRLPELPALERLKIESPILNRVSGLTHLTTLRELDLRRCKMLHQLRGLSKLRALEGLWLDDTRVKDLKQLTLLPLVRLGLGHTPARELKPLSRLSRLRWLDLCHTTSRTLTPLASLPLQVLDLRGASWIRDLAPLTDQGTLDTLLLGGCPRIVDFRPLLRLPRLAVLDVGRTLCARIDLLWRLPALRWLRVRGGALESHPALPRLETLLRARGGGLFDQRLPPRTP